MIANTADDAARTSIADGRSPPAPIGTRTLLVVNERVLHVDDVPASIRALIEGKANSVFVIVPALNSRLRTLVSDSDAAVARAGERLHEVLDDLRAVGVEAAGEIGDEDPLLAIADVLRARAVDRIVMVVHSAPDENWREKHLVKRVTRRFGLPVSEVVVDKART